MNQRPEKKGNPDYRHQETLFDMIEELQATIRHFVKDIGYDVDKFTEHSKTARKRLAQPGITSHETYKPFSHKVRSKIKGLYKTHGITSEDYSAAFSLLPSAGKLELYEALAGFNNTDSLTVDLSGAVEEKSLEKEKSRLELIKLQRDSRRRRRKFKGGKVHAGNKTIMGKHRLLVASILQEYTDSLNCENERYDDSHHGSFSHHGIFSHHGKDT